ncbi:MAG: hypothetical protein AB1489_13500 [Acidobacteriota bacterium]
MTQWRLLSRAPSVSSINRWLKSAGLIVPSKPEVKTIFYPAPRLKPDLILQAMDWTARYLKGGEKIFVFHTIDTQTHALSQTLCLDKSTVAALSHILQAWQELGLPDFLQIDNDSAFNGIGIKWRLGGDFMRLALYFGVELIFIPPAEPKRNYLVEGINHLWAISFWNKNHFRHGIAEVKGKSGKFLQCYQTYAPPALQGLTIAQAQ